MRYCNSYPFESHYAADLMTLRLFAVAKLSALVLNDVDGGFLGLFGLQRLGPAKR